MLRRTSALLCTAAVAARVTGELQKLLPALLPRLDPPLQTGTHISAAHLIAATSHGSNRGAAHAHDCPVLARAVPLTAVAENAIFLKCPCLPCLKRRIHFLASEHFCMSFKEQCVQRGGNAVPAEWLSIVGSQFGSLVRLEEELVLYATSRREPGWTWLVYDRERLDGHRLVVVNMPCNRAPLVQGLWPLAVVNMTESALLAKMTAETGPASAHVTPPSWSRAARNPPAAAATRVAAATVEDDLAAIRAQVALEAVANMNWGFVLQQWQKAEAYYTSADREEKIGAHRAKLERNAALEAMKKLHDSGATILMSDTVEITTPAAGGRGSGTSGVVENAPQKEGQAQTADAAQESKTGAAATGAVAEQDPQCTHLADGTWQYTYRNGDVTLLRPDGTRVFKKSDLTTTVFSDGSTLYAYPNNTSILDRADGVRVTTFADGTIQEERIK